jgi:hypothetical protein
MVLQHSSSLVPWRWSLFWFWPVWSWSPSTATKSYAAAPQSGQSPDHTQRLKHTQHLTHTRATYPEPVTRRSRQSFALTCYGLPSAVTKRSCCPSRESTHPWSLCPSQRAPGRARCNARARLHARPWARVVSWAPVIELFFICVKLSTYYCYFHSNYYYSETGRSHFPLLSM